jgi:hypothetical protein
MSDPSRSMRSRAPPVFGCGEASRAPSAEVEAAEFTSRGSFAAEAWWMGNLNAEPWLEEATASVRCVPLPRSIIAPSLLFATWTD